MLFLNILEEHNLSIYKKENLFYVTVVFLFFKFMYTLSDLLIPNRFSFQFIKNIKCYCKILWINYEIYVFSDR
jgi:hypothetical protein